MENIKLKDEYIKLGQAIKLVGWVQDGLEAKYEITEGKVAVNGDIDLRRGRKLYNGDIVTYKGNSIKIMT